MVLNLLLMSQEIPFVKKEQFYKLAASHLPEVAIDYCCDLWLLYDFSLKISKDRKTKLGDFRYDSRGKKYSVSVNQGLNPYAFLVTYIHEVAHVYTYRQYGRKARPHGPEWQQSFRQLAAPVLNEEVFPAEVLIAFKNYLLNPAASTSGNLPLSMAIRQYDAKEESQLLLANLGEGSTFLFKNRTFVKVGTKRTRALCTDLGNGRKYLISEGAQVKKVA